ncbi:MAG TPA: hypothetical protein PLO78_05360 [Candidatus Omnitrophota bacterium]|nr:hypothetical protein [Candidatus Omnitrophota bacterium]
MKNETTSRDQVCEHCRGMKHVLPYWLEKMLDRQGMHMTDIPPDIFQMIPVECIQYCHCNVRLLLFKHRHSQIPCGDCDGTTWRFTEAAERAGYRFRKVSQLSLDKIESLPAHYFERCACGLDERIPKRREKRKPSKNFALPDLKILQPVFSFCHG